jgi:uncharacterized protein (DUF1778 family)
VICTFREIRGLTMARYTDDPVKHVVTFRVNQEEKMMLEQLAKLSGRTISDFVRRNLDLVREKVRS